MTNEEIEQLIAEHKEKEYCFYTLLSALPDILFLMDKEGNYIKYRKGEGFLFIPIDKIIGSNIRDSGMPPDVIEKILKQNAEVITTGNRNEINYALSSPWGVEHHYESRAVKYDDTKALRIVRDVTEKVIAQEKVNQYIERLEKLTNMVSNDLRLPISKMQSLLNESINKGEDAVEIFEELKSNLNFLEQKVSAINQLVQRKK